jgi:hypothetical protein
VASCGSFKERFKQQALKHSKLVQLEKMSCKWFTAVCSEGKIMTGHMIIERAKYFYGKMKITDKYTFSRGSNKKIAFKNVDQYMYCLMCEFSYDSKRKLPVRTEVSIGTM